MQLCDSEPAERLVLSSTFRASGVVLHASAMQLDLPRSSCSNQCPPQGCFVYTECADPTSISDLAAHRELICTLSSAAMMIQAVFVEHSTPPMFRTKRGREDDHLPQFFCLKASARVKRLFATSICKTILSL